MMIWMENTTSKTNSTNNQAPLKELFLYLPSKQNLNFFNKNINIIYLLINFIYF